MKKLIGIILALCMLGTMASAATIENPNATATLSTMTVSVTYTALANNAQATLFAYKVANDATLDNAESIAYKNQTDTPIVGIDQEASDGTFDFKVDATFRGKIAVKVGGADVATPVTMLVEFADPVTPPVDPDQPGTGGGAGGEEPDPEPVVVTVLWGDVNSDGSVDVGDASDVIKAITGGQKVYGDYTIGVKFAGDVLWGDVNVDGSVDVGDASDVIKAITGGQKVYGDYTIGVNATLTK